MPQKVDFRLLYLSGIFVRSSPLSASAHLYVSTSLSVVGATSSHLIFNVLFSWYPFFSFFFFFIDRLSPSVLRHISRTFPLDTFPQRVVVSRFSKQVVRRLSSFSACLLYFLLGYVIVGRILAYNYNHGHNILEF